MSNVQEPHKSAILFVCLGNICRSPLAEAAFRRAAVDAGLAVHVDSAGTSDWHVGKAPDPRAQAKAREHGVEIGHYRGRQIEAADYARFTHIFALDWQNLADIQSRAPAGATARIALLLDLVAEREGQAVTDPYYGDDAGFADTWADVTAAATALVERLRR